MGRPEPCALFSHSFVHAQLDEYVDEVLFAGPVVVTGCEFLEQNASPSVPAVSLIGTTSPPSFALEVFVHCEGESRFRRLCQPFLYSPSSSNVLEVEAVVTNHLVVRGTYRSLSMVIYGNTAEDLGQFNIDVDMDSSLANLIYSSSEGKIEDLPPPLRSMKLSLEDSISSLNTLSLPLPVPDLSNEMKEFLLLVFKIWQTLDLADALCKAVMSLVSSFLSGDFGPAVSFCLLKLGDYTEGRKNLKCVLDVLSNARDELRKLWESHQSSLESEKGKPSEDEGPEWLVYSLSQCFPSDEKITAHGSSLLCQNKSIIFWLGIALLLCSARGTCCRFVKSGGMKKICSILSSEFQSSAGTTLLLLCAIEQATRHAVGCEAFLGWWPRKDIDVPVGNSEGYCHLLGLLMQKKRHDAASLVTYILHRLRIYEVSARYESEVLSLVMNLSADRIDSLGTADSLLKSILKLLNIQVAVEDSSPAALAKSSAQGQQELLSYKETVDFISESKHSFSSGDVDPHVLFLLKERGFLPLSAALLSSSVLRSGGGGTTEIFAEVAASIELILLRLLGCRSGLTFLLLQPEAAAALVSSLQGFEDSDRADYVTLRHATVLISKGFFCRPQDIGMIADVHLRVGSTIDRLLSSSPHSEEQLWTLWELCAISRSESGRQALLSVGQFPEAVSVLIQILHSFKDVEPVGVHVGSSSSNLAIFHFAAEIIEVIVVDSNASSLASWIRHAVDLHGALHVSSPGLNKKDAPSRVLDWIDAGVVYNKSGIVGLLRYAAVLASGGDAHLSSASVLVSESMDVENFVGDSGSSSDSLFVDNLLGKFVSDKQFDGVALPNMSLVQLTTAFRILAFVSENSTVAALLFDEGAVTLVLIILMNCRFILERSSNTFDYLVDEGTECGSTSDLLMEQSIEQSVVELMIPSLILLINLLQKLQEAKEQYRNTKLLKALLRLHRELSPKLAACEAEVSFQYRSSALSLCTVCRLLASAMACWPIFGWTPGLFHCLMESIQASSSSLTLGPKDACSFLYLLGDLFPEEGIWLWKNNMPSLSAIRTLSVGTMLGPEGEKCIEWHLQPEHLTVLLGRLTPQLNKIAQIVLHFCSADLVVIRDMLRVLVIRISCQRAEYADPLLEPVMSWICDHMKEIAGLLEMDLFKTYRLLDFIASLLEHPYAKELLLRMGILKILEQILRQCHEAFVLEESQVLESKARVLNFCMSSFKLLALIFDSRDTESEPCIYDKISFESTSVPDCSGIMSLILNLCKFLPVGKELLGCLLCLKEMISSVKGRSAFLSISLLTQLPETGEQVEQEIGSNLSDMSDWRNSSPFLVCWRKLLGALQGKDGALTYAVESIHLLSLSSLCICGEGENLGTAISVLKSLFGLSSEEFPEDLLKMIPLLDQKTEDDEFVIASLTPKSLSQAKEAVKSLISLLQNPISSSHKDSPALTLSTPYYSFARLLRFSPDYDENITNSFVWECADTAPERLMMSSLNAKRKVTSAEGSVRRPRDSSSSEALNSNGFPRGLGPITSNSVPSRRDTFRQRKPNTSRPPSMHVDDYVARERNADVASSSASMTSTGQRGGISSGRPPSIHVDEFMARQRERQNSSGQGIVGDAAVQGKNVPVMTDNESEKADKSQKLKAVLDDDHEINIVFDDEPESDDKLPFPQPDDNLLPAPVIGASSPSQIMEDTESRGNMNARPSNAGNPDLDDVHLRRRHSSQMEPSTSDKRTFFQDQFSSVYNTNQSQSFADSQYSQSGFYPRDSPQRGPPSKSSSSPVGPQVYHDSKSLINQPPLPPTPPPAMSPIQIQTGQTAIQNYSSGRDLQPPLPSGFPLLQGHEVNAPGSVSVPNFQPAANNPSSRTLPPLPTLLPPFSSPQRSAYSSQATTKISLSSRPGMFSASGGGLTVHSLPPFTPWQAPLSAALFTSTPGQTSVQSTQPRLAGAVAAPPLPPPPPLAPPRPSLPQQQSRSGVQFLQPPSVQVQLQPLQVPQQLQIPHHLLYYQSQQQDKFTTSLPPQTSLDQPQSSSDSKIQEQDPGLSLQQYFSSPEAIESLLNDRDKLCQLLEQHPKLVQMLQERLGQI